MSDYVDQYTDWMRDVRRSQETSVAQYQAVCAAFEAAYGDPALVDVDEVEEFIQRVRRGGVRPSPATQARDRAILAGWFKWMQHRRLRDDNPALETAVPRVRNRQPRAVPDDLMARLWASAMPDEDRVWLGLAAFCGLRRSEIVTVTADHFDLSAGLISHLERKGGGTYPIEYQEMICLVGDHLPHVLPKPERLLNLVEWLVEVRPGDYLVPWSRGGGHADDVNRRLCQLLDGAGLAVNTFTPHALRHTAATNMLRCGVPLEIAADQLSHSSIETTRRYLRTSGQLSRWRKG